MKKLLLLIFFCSSVFYLKAQTWVNLPSLPSSARTNVNLFENQGNLYVNGGSDGTVLNDTWEYNLSTGTWTQKANFPGANREAAISVTIDSLSYIGLGWDFNTSSSLKDIYSYNSRTDVWTFETNYPFAGGRNGFWTTVGNKIYIGGGSEGTILPYSNRFAEYDIITKTWTAKANLPFGGRAGGISFSFNGFVYCGMGHNGSTDSKDLWRYDPITDGWTQVMDFPGTGRLQPQSFIDSNRAIIGGGFRLSNPSVILGDYYKYNPVTDSWVSICAPAVAQRSNSESISINGKGYISCGRSNAGLLNDLIEFSFSENSFTRNTCFIDSLIENVSIPNATYNWSTGSTGASQVFKTSGKFFVDITLDGCLRTDTFNISINTNLIDSFLGNDTTICQGDSITLTVQGATNQLSYLWSDGSTNSSLTVKNTGRYWCEVSNGNCSKRDSVEIFFNSTFPINSFLGNDTTICQGDSITLTVQGATNQLSYLWSNGSTNPSLIIKNADTYWCEIIEGNCSKRDSIEIGTTNCNSNLISGTINSYAKVTAINVGQCLDTIVTDNSSGFNVGDKVLIIQMQGATADNSNSTNFGDLIATNNAGNFEYFLIQEILGSSIIISSKLISNYNISGNVQLVSVPIYQNARINGTLSALPWDGNTGGILAFEVIDSLLLDADINIDSIGFRGGKNFFGSYSLDNSGCSKTDLFNPAGNFNGGQKGEGIAIINSNQEFGRGHFTNGGGAGNSHNSGGAGGANYGTGGLGGQEFSGCGSSNIGGIGGEQINYSPTENKVFLGGGGGGGDANGSGGSDGGNGGGLLFLKTKTIIGNNHQISANGWAADTATIDGAGGGGAGGSILLDVQQIIGNLMLSVRGGNGGNNNNSGSCVGTGGGGGGGLIWYSSLSIPMNVQLDTNPGINGLITNPLSTCFNSNYGATSGIEGGILYDLNLNTPLSSNSTISGSFLGDDTTICQGDSMNFDLTLPGFSYAWSDGSTSPLFTIKDSGIYWVDLLNNLGGCQTRDSIVVNVDPAPSFSLGNDTTLCQGDSIHVMNPQGDYVYLWNTGENTPTIAIQFSGTYWLRASLGSCSTTDSISININANSTIDLGPDTTLCIGDTLELDAFSPPSSYLWNTGSTDSIIKVSSTDQYSVISTLNNCSVIDSILVTFIDNSSFSLGNDTSLCNGEVLVLNSNVLSDSFLWQDASTNSTFTVIDAGTYSLSIQNTCGTVSDSIEVSLGGCNCSVEVPTIYTPNNDFINDNFELNTNCPLVSYSIQIYNRWGKQVFQSQRINNSWSGRSNGTKVRDGIYYYVLRYQFSETEEIQTKNGSVLLIE